MKLQLRELECLCDLGLPAFELVPMAVDLMERAMAGTHFFVTRANEAFEVIDCYGRQPTPDHIALLYAQEFHDSGEAELGPTFTQMLRERIALQNLSASSERFLSSAMYSKVFRPLGVRYSARVALLGQNVAHGAMSASRPDAAGEFTADDERLLLLFARSLARGLDLAGGSGVESDGEVADRLGEGLLVLDVAGRIQHGCATGLRLFHEATRANGAGQQPAPERLGLLHRLAASGVTGVSDHEVTLSNHRGQFGFRPVRVAAVGGGRADHVAVRVRRQGSMAARLWLDAERFGLSARERQVAVLLGLGQGYDDIARRLNLSRNTAVSYVRRTYDKLGVSQREQLLRVLLASAQPPAGRKAA